MILIGHYHVQLFALVSLIVVWLVTFQLLALLFSQLARGALAAWNVGFLGVTAIYLRKPSAFVRFLQFVFPLVGAGSAVYWLSRLQPMFVSSMPNVKDLHLAVAAVMTVILGAPRILGALYELRYPLWGEARFIDRVARAQSPIAFTAVGRAYIRERFDATPEEFVRIVRRRQVPQIFGTHS